MKINALLLFLTLNANAGEVKGKIHIEEWSSDKKEWVLSKDHSDAVVFINGFEEKPGPQRDIYLDQKNKNFGQRVLPVVAGESVIFRNLDDIYHNVWSLSQAKPFDLGSYKAPETKSVQFDRPGLIKVFCNIHPEMISTILVLKNNKYYRTKKDGLFHLDQLPLGEFELRVWVEGSTPVSKKIKVTEKSSENFTFTLRRSFYPIDHLNKLGKPYQKY